MEEAPLTRDALGVRRLRLAVLAAMAVLTLAGCEGSVGGGGKRALHTKPFPHGAGGALVIVGAIVVVAAVVAISGAQRRGSGRASPRVLSAVAVVGAAVLAAGFVLWITGH